MNNFSDAISILNTIIMLCALLGGYLAFRGSRQQSIGEIQSQVINALKAELETLQRRMDALEKENTRLVQIMGLIKSALRKRGLTISIDGDLVTISDNGSSQSARIQEDRP